VSQLFCRKMPRAGAVVFSPASAGAEWNNHPTRVGPHLGLAGRRCFIARGCRPTARAPTTCRTATLWRRTALRLDVQVLFRYYHTALSPAAGVNYTYRKCSAADIIPYFSCCVSTTACCASTRPSKACRRDVDRDAHDQYCPILAFPEYVGPHRKVRFTITGLAGWRRRDLPKHGLLGSRLASIPLAHSLFNPCPMVHRPFPKHPTSDRSIRHSKCPTEPKRPMIGVCVQRHAGHRTSVISSAA
jgi:hypothetical protein